MPETGDWQVSAASGTVKKFVRVTGLSVGLSTWNPVSILFSIVLSFSNMWNRKGEQEIRASGIDYTIIRPGEWEALFSASWCCRRSTTRDDDPHADA